jgi:hypothetical protein
MEFEGLKISIGAIVLSQWQRGWTMTLANNLYIVLRLRISGVIPLFPRYVYMVLTARKFTSPLKI